jgi:hypothetical protein
MAGTFYAELKAQAGTQELPYFELLLNTETMTDTATETPTEPSIAGYRVLR